MESNHPYLARKKNWTQNIKFSWRKFILKIFSDKFSNFLGPKHFRKNLLRNINEHWKFRILFFWNFKNVFSLIFRRNQFNCFGPKNCENLSENYFQITFSPWRINIFVQVFPLARYGWLHSIPHVYTASFCPCSVNSRKNFQNLLNLYLSGSFRERLHIVTTTILSSNRHTAFGDGGATRVWSVPVFFFPCTYKEEIDFLLVRRNPEVCSTRRKFVPHGGNLPHMEEVSCGLRKFDKDGESRQGSWWRKFAYFPDGFSHRNAIFPLHFGITKAPNWKKNRAARANWSLLNVMIDILITWPPWVFLKPARRAEFFLGVFPPEGRNF